MIWQIFLGTVCSLHNEKNLLRGLWLDLVRKVGPCRLYKRSQAAKISSFWARHAALPVMMADISAIEAVEISKIEHNLGELSSANLYIAKTLFDSNGFVAWQCLWSQDKRDVERETLNVLGSLSTENNFTYVKARSLLPREIVYNKFLTSFLEAHIPAVKLL